VLQLNNLYSTFVEELYKRANETLPTEGKDIIVVHAMDLLEGQLDKLLTQAVELNVPVLIRQYSPKFESMGREELMSNIETFFTYQIKKGRPPPTCQILGQGTENLPNEFLNDYFKSDVVSRTQIINVLDNPVELDPTLIQAFKIPPDIEDTDLIDFGIKRSADSHKDRGGIKIPSYRRWALVSSEFSVTGFHRDAKGFWTAVQLQSGSKNWFWWEDQERNSDYLIKHGQYSCPPISTKLFQVELQVGDLFILSPGLIHGVITKRDSFANGTHFLRRDNLDLSLQLSIDDAKAKYATTNDTTNAKLFYCQLLKVLWLPERC
jgi:hypothetical protein